MKNVEEPLTQMLVGEADPEIVALEARMRDAQLAADVSALDALIAEDLLFAGPDGQLATKAQDLTAYMRSSVARPATRRFWSRTRRPNASHGPGGERRRDT